VSILCAGFADAAFGVQGAPRKAFFQMMIMVADFPSAKYLSANNSLFSCHRVDLLCDLPFSSARACGMVRQGATDRSS
jgi:hypothetical protein